MFNNLDPNNPTVNVLLSIARNNDIVFNFARPLVRNLTDEFNYIAEKDLPYSPYKENLKKCTPDNRTLNDILDSATQTDSPRNHDTIPPEAPKVNDNKEAASHILKYAAFTAIGLTIGAVAVYSFYNKEAISVVAINAKDALSSGMISFSNTCIQVFNEYLATPISEAIAHYRS